MTDTSTENSDSSTTVDKDEVSPVVAKDVSKGAIPKTSRNCEKASEIVNSLRNNSQTMELIQPTTSNSKVNKTSGNVIPKNSKTENRSNALCTNETKKQSTPGRESNSYSGDKSNKLDTKFTKEAVTKMIDKLLRAYAFTDMTYTQPHEQISKTEKSPSSAVTQPTDEISLRLKYDTQNKDEAKQLLHRASALNTHVSQRIIEMYSTKCKWYKNVEKQLIKSIKEHDSLETQIKKLDFIIRNIDYPSNLRTASLLTNETSSIMQGTNSKINDIRKRLDNKKFRISNNLEMGKYEDVLAPQTDYINKNSTSNANLEINKNENVGKNKATLNEINDNKELNETFVNKVSSFPHLEKHLETCKEQKDTKASPKKKAIAEEQLNTAETSAEPHEPQKNGKAMAIIIEPDFCKVDRHQTTCGDVTSKKLKKKKIKFSHNTPKVNEEITDNEFLEESKELFKKWQDLPEFQNILHPHLVHIGKDRNIFIREAWIAYEIQYANEMLVKETPGMMKFRRRSPFHVEDWENIFRDRVNKEFPLQTCNGDKFRPSSWTDSEDYFSLTKPYF